MEAQHSCEMVNVKFRLRSSKTQKEILRRVSLTDPSLDMIRELIGIWGTSIETMLYIDNEGDGITLETTGEWDECLRLWREDGRGLLRIECTVRKLLSNRMIRELDQRGDVSRRILETMRQYRPHSTPPREIRQLRQLSAETVPDLKLPQMSAAALPEKVSASEQQAIPPSPQLSEAKVDTPPSSPVASPDALQTESNDTVSLPSPQSTPVAESPKEVIADSLTTDFERQSSLPSEGSITTPFPRLVVSPETVGRETEMTQSLCAASAAEAELPMSLMSEVTVADISREVNVPADNLLRDMISSLDDAISTNIPDVDAGDVDDVGGCEEAAATSPRIEISEEVVHSDAILPLAGTATGSLCSASPTPSEDTLVSIPKAYPEEDTRLRDIMTYDSTVSQRSDALLRMKKTLPDTPRSDFPRSNTENTDSASLRLRVHNNNADAESSAYTPLVRSINSKDLESGDEDGGASELSFASTDSFFMCEGEDWQVTSELQAHSKRE